MQKWLLESFSELRLISWYTFLRADVCHIEDTFLPCSSNKGKLFHYLNFTFMGWKVSLLPSESTTRHALNEAVINVCLSMPLSLCFLKWWITATSKRFPPLVSLFRFKLTTTKFAVIANRAAQESIYQVYVCHQTQRHNQLPPWDSTLSRGHNPREFATVMVS